MKARTRPIPVPPSTGELGAKLREARRINAQIGEVAKRGRRATAELAYLLAHFERNGLHRALGYADVGVYAVEEGHTATERRARDLVAVVKVVERFPLFQQSFREGRVFWTKIRTIAPVITPESEAELHADVLKLTVRKLEAKVSKKQGTPQVVRRVFELTLEDAAWVEQRVAQVRKEARRTGQKLSEGQALARICKGAIEDAGARGESPANKVVIHACECGKKATIETREGPVEVSKATLEQALCDAELVDVRGGPKKVTTTVPKKTRRHVMDRDRGRCQAPGCKNLGHLHVHHEGGRLNVGHDPERMTLLCTAHHPDRHDDRFAIQGTYSTGFRFVLPDGQELKGSPREEGAREASPAGATSIVADLQLAKVALVSLELGAREAEKLLALAREELEANGEPCSVDALVRGALQRL